MKAGFIAWAGGFWLATTTLPPAPLVAGQQSVAIVAFCSGEELIVHIRDLDQLRQEHRLLKATLSLDGEGGKKRFALDLHDPVLPESLVVDLAGYGRCDHVSLDVRNRDGHVLLAWHVTPIPVVASSADLPLVAGKFAAIEPGTSLGADDVPRIPLPDVARMRQEKLEPPARTVAVGHITYPVVSNNDLPVLGSQNYVLVSRQSSAAEDATKCSLYFSYRKAVCDAATMRLKRWRKFLVEVPLQQEWLVGEDDDVLTLPLDAFAIHTSEEVSPGGYNILGESPGGLAQGGQSADTDEAGRIYFANIEKGAGLVRFDPRSRKFQQPPGDFPAECRKLIPANSGWVRNWDAALGELLCIRGRVYVLYARNYRVRTPNGNFETCSGVISVPQEGWDDAARFRADIRLHAGSWEGATWRLYETDVPAGDYSRKAVAPLATAHGLYFSSAPGQKGGPWRLDLDGQGNTMRLAVVKDLRDAVTAGGVALPPTFVVQEDGLTKQRRINVGSAGRPFLQFTYGEFRIPRAALSLTLPGAPKERLVDAGGHYRTTYDAAPKGALTVRFDIAAKIRADAARHAELAAALRGVSQGPAYGVTAIPGEAERAIAVCEYGYYFSKLDFSRRAAEGCVFKEYLPFLSGGRKTNLPTQVGLGPYSTMWAEHDDALWLYLPGYIGMSRLKYADGGRVREAFAADMFHERLVPGAADGTPRRGVKDFRHIFPALGGRMIDISHGRPGRGGTAFATGLELFDPRSLGQSRTVVRMSRCYDLWTPASRVVLSATGAAPQQQIFAASSAIRSQYVADLADPALLPANRDPKIFAYDGSPDGGLRDLYGFAVPTSAANADGSVHLAFSPCRQFLILLQGDGSMFSYSVARRSFLDGLRLRNAAAGPVQLLEFARPGAFLWTAPTGRLFLFAASEGPASSRVSFYEVVVSHGGRLAVRPHLAILLGNGVTVADFDRIVRCFLPDLTRRDGSYDLVLGGSHQKDQPIVRVIEDFLPPRASRDRLPVNP